VAEDQPWRYNHASQFIGALLSGAIDSWARCTGLKAGESIYIEEIQMKKFAIGVLSVLMAAGFTVVALAQGGPRGTSTLTLKGKTISVEYGRPSLKGRTTDALLGKLPAGGFWRMGSDMSTTFKTDLDLVFGDVTVPAGEYSLWMQRQEDNSCKLLFNKVHGQLGAKEADQPGSGHDPTQDFASVPLKESKAAKPVETLTLSLRKAGGGTLTVQWGTLEVAASFKAK